MSSPASRTSGQKYRYELRAPGYEQSGTSMWFRWSTWKSMSPGMEDMLMYNYISGQLDVMDVSLSTEHTEINGLRAWVGKYRSGRKPRVYLLV